MSISAGPKRWSSRLILSTFGAVPLIADDFAIWFSQALLPLQAWIQHVFPNDFSDFSLSLSLISIAFIHSIFLGFNPERLASSFQRKTPPRSVSVPRCARGLGEVMCMGSDKLLDLLSCRSLIWQLPTIALKSWIFQRQALLGEQLDGIVPSRFFYPKKAPPHKVDPNPNFVRVIRQKFQSNARLGSGCHKPFYRHMFVWSYMYFTFWNFRHRLVRLYW